MVSLYGIGQGKNAEKFQKLGRNFMKDNLQEISKEKPKLLSRIKRIAGQVTAVEHFGGAVDRHFSLIARFALWCFYKVFMPFLCLRRYVI